MAGTDFGAFEINILTPNTAPQFVSTAPTTGRVGEGFSYQLQATDADHDPLTYEVLVGPSGMVVDPFSGLIRWTPGGDQSGTIDVVARVSDDRGGVGLQSFRVTVEAANAAPIITSLPPQQAVAGLPYEYRVRAQDGNGDALSYSLDVAPAGAVSIDATTGRLSYAPTLAELGDHDGHHHGHGCDRRHGHAKLRAHRGRDGTEHAARNYLHAASASSNWQPLLLHCQGD